MLSIRLTDLLAVLNADRPIVDVRPMHESVTPVWHPYWKPVVNWYLRKLPLLVTRYPVAVPGSRARFKFHIYRRDALMLGI